MVTVSNAHRVVYPDVQRTKGDVVTYYERIAPRALEHLRDRPLSIKRYPKGTAAPGFFQKNVPPHYPASITRFEVPRQPTDTRKRGARAKDKEPEVTVYPLVQDAEHLAYLANQGAIELHVTTARAPALQHPDRLVIDLDPPAGAVELARRAALATRDALAAHGLASALVATGSKGYHVVAPIETHVAVEALSLAARQFSTLLAETQPDVLTTAFRIAERGKRVFVDWLRNNPSASIVAPYSLRATARATVATPIAWDELAGTAPDAFNIDDLERLCTREDPLAQLARTPGDARRFVDEVSTAFAASGLVLEPFDRFRS